MPWHGSIGADLIDASASVRAPIGQRFHVAAGFRKSYLDSVLPVFSDEDVGELFPIPRTTDAIARVAYVPSRGESLELGGFYSSDAVDRTVPSVDPTQFKQESRELSFWRSYLRYESELDDGSTVTLVPWFGRDESSARKPFRRDADPARNRFDAVRPARCLARQGRRSADGHRGSRR